MALATTKATALFFYCLRLNEGPNELIFREFLLIVHRLDFEYKIFIVSYARDCEQFII